MSSRVDASRKRARLAFRVAPNASKPRAAMRASEIVVVWLTSWRLLRRPRTIRPHAANRGSPSTDSKWVSARSMFRIAGPSQSSLATLVLVAADHARNAASRAAARELAASSPSKRRILSLALPGRSKSGALSSSTVRRVPGGASSVAISIPSPDKRESTSTLAAGVPGTPICDMRNTSPRSSSSAIATNVAFRSTVISRRAMSRRSKRSRVTVSSVMRTPKSDVRCPDEHAPRTATPRTARQTPPVLVFLAGTICPILRPWRQRIE